MSRMGWFGVLGVAWIGCTAAQTDAEASLSTVGDPDDPCAGELLSGRDVTGVDLLLVIDNSGSMALSQRELTSQLPRLLNTLTTGIRPDGTVFPPARSLHLAVASTDMGIAGVAEAEATALGCGDPTRPFGDDGVFRNAPNPAGRSDLACAPDYPPYIGYALGDNPMLNTSRLGETARHLECIASLGTTGCGVEMPLEAALRALWPSHPNTANAAPTTFVDGRTFMDGTMSGQGSPLGPNAGFVRTHDETDASVLAVVVLSDRDDCSSHDTSHFVPNDALPDDHPLKHVSLNLRCYNESWRVGGEDARDNGEANLFATHRYVQGLKALRPGREDLVVFAAIAGVPLDLAATANLSNDEFRDPVARGAYYDTLLDDVRMLEQPDGTQDPRSTTLMPSCLRTDQPTEGNPIARRAFPPRRLAKVARGFGDNGVMASICSNDLSPAIDSVADRIATRLTRHCLPHALPRDVDGRVACDVIWELPLPSHAPASTPVTCDQLPALLLPPPPGQPTTTADGRARCRLKQVPVFDAATNDDPQRGNTDGWFYDDFSQEVAGCPVSGPQRISFTRHGQLGAIPMDGITARLACPEFMPAACR